MPLKQNNINELPDYIDNNYLLTNKQQFDICLKDIDNPKIRLFHKFNKMIMNKSFKTIYAIYDFENFGWFWDYHENPFYDHVSNENEKIKLLATLDLFERFKRLSYKNYTQISPEYQNIRFYKFTYTSNDKIDKPLLSRINNFTKYHFIKKNTCVLNTPIIFKKIIFTKNYIHIYIHKHNYQDNSALDITFNILWAYDLIIICLKLLISNNVITFNDPLYNFEKYKYFQHFQINNNVVDTEYSFI
jgi:hypothetical protein